MTKKKPSCAQLKIGKVMREYSRKKLKTHGKVVKSKKQAIAIAYSEARDKCGD